MVGERTHYYGQGLTRDYDTYMYRVAMVFRDPRYMYIPKTIKEMSVYIANSHI